MKVAVVLVLVIVGLLAQSWLTSGASLGHGTDLTAEKDAVEEVLHRVARQVRNRSRGRGNSRRVSSNESENEVDARALFNAMVLQALAKLDEQAGDSTVGDSGLNISQIGQMLKVLISMANVVLDGNGDSLN